MKFVFSTKAMKSFKNASSFALLFALTLVGSGVGWSQGSLSLNQPAEAQTACDTTIRSVSFSGRTSGSMTGKPNVNTNMRSNTTTSASILATIPPNTALTLTGWAYGQGITDIWTGKVDYRWFRVNYGGRTGWVASGVIYGNPPNAPISPTCPPASSGNIDIKPNGSNLTFSRGKQWVTGNGYKFVFQMDGNLVLYNSLGRPVWATGSEAMNATLFAVQADGNIVLYASNKAIWATNTAGKVGAFLSVQTDGNLVVYSSTGQALWATNTVGGNSSGIFNAASRWLTPNPPPPPTSGGSYFRNFEAFVHFATGQVGIARLDRGDLKGQCVTLIARYIQEVFLSGSDRTKPVAFGNGRDTASIVASTFSQHFLPITNQGLPKRGAIVSFPGIGYVVGVGCPNNYCGHTAIVMESRTLNGQRQMRIMDSNGDSKNEKSTVTEYYSRWINIPNGTANGYGNNIYWTNPR